jgi:hypothetical protein
VAVAAVVIAFLAPSPKRAEDRVEREPVESRAR